MNFFPYRIILLFLLYNASTFAGVEELEKVVANACMSCEEMKNLRLPGVTIVEATAVAEDENGSSNRKAHCKIQGRIDTEIEFELLLPEDWNGRFAMGGGGGFVGTVQNMVNYSVNSGFATAGTDTGHKGNGIKADWALNNMERQLNFGHMAIHKTAEVSKMLIFYYYCKDPDYSYFLGCSRGGGQAMMEAQRYPEDFDGIVAMAPAFNWTGFGAEMLQNARAIYPDPDDLENPVITKDNLRILQQSVLDACDALDGLKDDLINDPRDCDFDCNTLPLCADGEQGKDCFTREQIQAIKTIYDGLVIDGEEIHPGFPYGGENENGGWPSWIVGPVESLKSLNFPSLQFGFSTETFKYLIFNDPEWDYSTYDFADFKETTAYAASYLDATSTDYSVFKNSGGKIIFTHGWEDAALSALATIDHFEALSEKDPEAGQFAKLYLLPGVLHCIGGRGPYEVDWLEIIVNWVENDMPPDRVIVTKEKKGKNVMSRPIYPYPRKANYDGKGDPDDAASFR